MHIPTETAFTASLTLCDKKEHREFVWGYIREEAIGNIDIPFVVLCWNIVGELRANVFEAEIGVRTGIAVALRDYHVERNLNSSQLRGKSTIPMGWREAKGTKERFRTAVSASSWAMDGATLLRRAWKVKSHLAAVDSATKSKRARRDWQALLGSYWI